MAVGAEMSAAAAAAAAVAEAEEAEHETASAAAAAAGDFDLGMMGSPAGLGAVGSEDEMEDSIEALRAASLGSQEGVLDGCEEGLLGGDTEVSMGYASYCQAYRQWRHASGDAAPPSLHDDRLVESF